MAFDLYGILNRFSCIYTNETNDVNHLSECELNHYAKFVLVPTKTSSYYKSCTISNSSRGIVGYDYNYTSKELIPKYCMGYRLMSNGNIVRVLYLLNRTDDKGGLVRVKGYLYRQANGYIRGNTFGRYIILYSTESSEAFVSAVSASNQSGYYNSILYKGVVLEHIDGFKLVYKDQDKNVLIYEIVNQ